MLSHDELLVKLKAAKQKLHNLWDEKGLTDEAVLKAAEEVDELINEYNLLYNLKLNSFRKVS